MQSVGCNLIHIRYIHIYRLWYSVEVPVAPYVVQPFDLLRLRDDHLPQIKRLQVR